MNYYRFQIVFQTLHKTFTSEATKRPEMAEGSEGKRVGVRGYPALPEDHRGVGGN